MKILVDENIPSMTVQALREMNYDILDIRGTEKEGISDKQLWDLLIKEERLLITTDKGFLHYREQKHHGILVIRLRQPNKIKIHERVLNSLGQYSANEWKDMIVVIRDYVQSVWKGK